jgi:uncharacterized membrane protein YjjB (DUF3815 family)
VSSTDSRPHRATITTLASFVAAFFTGAVGEMTSSSMLPTSIRSPATTSLVPALPASWRASSTAGDGLASAPAGKHTTGTRTSTLSAGKPQ